MLSSGLQNQQPFVPPNRIGAPPFALPDYAKQRLAQPQEINNKRLSKIVDRKYLLQGVAAFSMGLLLRGMPARTLARKTWVPVDWKAYAKIILGIKMVNDLNKAFDFNPPPWLNGIQAVAAITPLTMGLTKTSLKQFVFIAPLVAGVVQSAVWLNDRLTQPLKEKFKIPPLVTQLGVSTGMIALGALASHKLLKNLGIGAAAMMTCARGCSPGSIICLSEAGEMLGAMKNWWKGGK